MVEFITFTKLNIKNAELSLAMEQGINAGFTINIYTYNLSISVQFIVLYYASSFETSAR